MYSTSPSSRCRRRRSSPAEPPQTEYGAPFVDDYHWLYDDVGLCVGTATPGVRAALLGLPEGARVLDAACGIGIDALALAGRGFAVIAADASPAMVRRCRERTSSAGFAITTVCSEWGRLPEHLPSGSLDAVLCTGNSLAHAAGREPMIDAFDAFAQLLKPGGALIIDSHNWEVLHGAGERTVVDPTVVERGGRSCRRSFTWSFPDGASGPYLLAIEFRLTGDDGEVVRRHQVELHPFSVSELRARLRECGFGPIAIDANPDDDRYAAVASRAG